MSFLNCPATVIGAVLALFVAASANAEPARTLRGSVEGGQDGEPIWVGVFGEEAAEGSWTEATGASFEVALPPGEPATLLVVSKNRVPHKLAVGTGSPAPVALRLAAGLELAGTVRSEEGAPLADAEIAIEAAESDGFEVPPFAAPRWRSDRRGGFRIGGLRAGSHVVTLTAEGHVPRTLEDVQVAGGLANRIEAELPVAHFVAGRVVDGDGAPVAGVDVHVFGQAEASTTTNVDGAYRLGPFRKRRPRDRVRPHAGARFDRIPQPHRGAAGWPCSRVSPPCDSRSVGGRDDGRFRAEVPPHGAFPSD